MRLPGLKLNVRTRPRTYIDMRNERRLPPTLEKFEENFALGKIRRRLSPTIVKEKMLRSVAPVYYSEREN